MAPLHPQRRSGKGGGQQSIKTHTSSEHSSPKSNTNSDHSQAVSSSRKLSKRKIRDTYSSETTDYKSNGARSSNAGSEENIPNLPSSSSEQSNPTCQFRAQSTNSEIEKDGLCVTNAGAHYNDFRPNTGSEGKDSCSNSSMANKQNREELIDSTYSIDENERKLIEIASYVTDISPEDVKECMLVLIGKGEQVTKEKLLDECLNRKSKLESRPGHTFVAKNFPRQKLLNGTSGIAKTSLSHPELTARTTSASLQNASALPGASSIQHQANNGMKNGKHKEDQVDLPNNHANNPSTNSKRKADNPSAVYHSRVNNVASHSSAKHVDSPRNSHVDPSKNAKDTPRDAPLEKTYHAQKADGSKGQEFTRSTSSNSQNASVTAAHCAAASSGAQNDLNKESSQAVPSKKQPLKEVNLAEYLATCLKLVRDENMRLDNARHCGQCGSKPRDITFLPCGHVWACRSCAGPLYVCPCCKKNIIATVDTYLC